MRTYYTYILASCSRRLYVGVTNDLYKRTWQHKFGTGPSFSRSYLINKLVYFEGTPYIRSAIAREKQLKAWPRWRKERLIEQHNAGWRDLSVDWF